MNDFFIFSSAIAKKYILNISNKETFFKYYKVIKYGRAGSNIS